MAGIFESGGEGSERQQLLTKDCQAGDDNGCEVSVNTTLRSRSTVSEPRAIDRRENEEKYAVYLERWYVMGIYTLLSIVGVTVWNVWGPIEDTASVVFNIERSQFALLPNWSNIIYILAAFPISWFVSVKGLRLSMLLSAGLMVIGCGIPCIPVPNHMMIWVMHIGQILNGFATTITQGLVTLVTVTWFPLNERVTATAVMSSGASIGLASIFLIAPWIVSSINATTTQVPLTPAANVSHNYLADDYHIYIEQIRLLLYIQFGASVFMLIVVLIRFPAKPALPPTASASSAREDTKSGLLALAKKKVFWIPCLGFAISQSGSIGWTTQMVFIFKDKASQSTVGWMGFYNNLAALVGALIVGRFADYFVGKMKPILIFLLVSASVSYSWVILLVMDYISYNLGSLYASSMLYSVFIAATTPLFFEITMEGAFPVGEETSLYTMIWTNGIFTMLFLVLPMIPSVGQNFDWLNWAVLGVTVVCIPIMAFYKEQYNRLDIDTNQLNEDSNQNRRIDECDA